jgi:hypothetical protein
VAIAPTTSEGDGKGVRRVARAEARSFAPAEARAAPAKLAAAPAQAAAAEAEAPSVQLGPLQEYWLDAHQRSILFLDILRRRGNTYFEHNAQTAPNVLHFGADVVLDGRTLPRPVNYAVVSIEAPEGVVTDPAKAPFIVVDPRAGHGPGIGGMKQDSEIGMALRAGHPCYFVGFLPEPVPGQTIEDVWTAEAAFVEAVAARHPLSESKPIVIANCQAGWQTMIMAATRPELTGPILLAGSPLSYWAGVRGKNPMRYFGGVMGGAWAAALAGDLGGGIFDGANLVANFESLNLANTWWEKPYNVYSKVDTEADRFLDFETWWGSPVLLNAEEMLWIANELFIGNKLSSGELHTSDGLRIDLRNIRAPIIVFCSWGDNITPPQQALDWITDLYARDEEIARNGQTIVYTLHQSIGHLGIFVSGKVATKEHREFVSCMDMIYLAPPGLYEAVITEADGQANGELIDGRYLFRLEPRTLADIRALGGNSPEDDLRFATAARVSEIGLDLYKLLAGMPVRLMTPPAVAEALRRLHPNRMRFALFSDQNPMMREVEARAERVREARAPVASDNPYLMAQQAASNGIAAWLDALGTARDRFVESWFLSVYGSPLLQAAVGVDQRDADRRITRDLVREVGEARSRSGLDQQFEAGGPAEAACRALFYIRMPEGAFDERSFALLRSLRAERPAAERRSLGDLRAMFKEQFLLMRSDSERAIEAIPKLLPDDPKARQEVLDLVKRVEAARELPPEGRRRLERVERLFGSGVKKGATEPETTRG